MSSSIGANESLTVGANQAVTVGAVQSQKIGGNQAITVGGADTTNADSNLIEHVAGGPLVHRRRHVVHDAERDRADHPRPTCREAWAPSS